MALPKKGQCAELVQCAYLRPAEQPGIPDAAMLKAAVLPAKAVILKNGVK